MTKMTMTTATPAGITAELAFAMPFLTAARAGGLFEKLTKCCVCGAKAGLEVEHAGAGFVFANDGSIGVVAICAKHRHTEPMSLRQGYLFEPGQGLTLAKGIVAAADEHASGLAGGFPAVRRCAPWEWPGHPLRGFGAHAATVLRPGGDDIEYRCTVLLWGDGEEPYVGGAVAIAAWHCGTALAAGKVSVCDIRGKPLLFCDDDGIELAIQADIAAQRIRRAVRAPALTSSDPARSKVVRGPRREC